MDFNLDNATLKSLIGMAKKGQPPSVLLSLTELGIPVVEIARRVGTAHGNISAFLHGHKPLPEKHLAVLYEMLKEAVISCKKHAKQLHIDGSEVRNSILALILNDKYIANQDKMSTFIDTIDTVSEDYAQRIKLAEHIIHKFENTLDPDREIS